MLFRSKPSSGLHASAKKKGSQQVEWSDIGAATISKVGQIIRKHQPLTWYYMMSIAQPESRGNHAVKERRPAAAVSRHLNSNEKINDESLLRLSHMPSHHLTSHATTRHDCYHLHAVFSILHFLHLPICLLTVAVLGKCRPTAPSRVL